MTRDQNYHLYQQGSGQTPTPYKTLADGTALWVYLMTFGKGRLCIGHVNNLNGYDRGFCYKSPAAAFKAADEWDGTGDPQGWFKNLQTGEYREPVAP